jgi:hypothetical protein
MKSAATLTYPLAKSRVVASSVMLPLPRHFNYTSGSTGKSGIVLLSNVSANTTIVPDSSEIGAFDASGLLVGSGTIMNGKTAFVVHGDNAMTKEKDGLTPSEAISFKVWTPSGEEYMATYSGTGSATYADNAIMLGNVSINKTLETNRSALVSVSPNPFHGIVRIGFDVAGTNSNDLQSVEINVYDARGSLVRQLSKGMYTSGHYTVTWNASDHISSNMYIVMMKSEKFTQKIKIFKTK